MLAASLVSAAPAFGAGFGAVEPFNLAGAGPSGPTSVAASEDGTVASVWPADPGLSWFIPRPPAAEVAFQRPDGSRATFRVGTIAAGTTVGLAMDRRGTATVVWQNDGSTTTIFVARCTSGGCTRARRFATGRLGWFPALAADRDGRVLVVWRGRTKAGRASLLHRLIERGRFGRIGAIGEAADRPVVATAGRRFVVAWRAGAGIRTTTVRDGGRSAPARTAVAGRGIASVRLTGSSSGALLAWRPPGGARQLAVAEVDDRGRVRSPEFVDAARNAPFDLARAPTGAAVLAWCPAGPGMRNAIVAATRAPGGRLGAPQTLGASRDGDPSAAIDDTGRATVAWAGDEPAWRDISSDTPFAAVAESGSAFGGAISVDTRPCPRLPDCQAGPQSLRAPDVTAAGRQTAVVWVSRGEGVGARLG